MRITRRREAVSKWVKGARETIGRTLESQVFRSLFTVILIAGLASSSFYWGMWVERGKPKPTPSATTGYREPVVTERSEDTPKTAPKKPSQPTATKPAVKPAATAPATQPKAVVKPAAPTPAAKPARPVFSRPVVGETLASYEWVYSPTFGDWRFHTGVDIKAEIGTPVKAAQGGTVQSVKQDAAYGTVVTIDHGSGLVAMYAGLDDVAVAAGEKVATNQVIGLIGEPGPLEADMGPHLHFELKRNGAPENPVPLLPK